MFTDLPWPGSILGARVRVVNKTIFALEFIQSVGQETKKYIASGGNFSEEK